MPKCFNTGLIILIAKDGERLEPKSYRPFTMQNAIYKVMAKAGAIRSERVRPMQFGFVLGRGIHEAILNVITTNIDWASQQEEP